eukprot:TRINITY_DN5350_c0_g1_i1.p1 TRINITY_DN5350_c0_g1~~TRINITY_DN5350_c0_g1_i1.p1  ORF type:complete len:396 (+),score=120.18 TRINITY_DN5350_c0_g1_i1:128-1189(+)
MAPVKRKRKRQIRRREESSDSEEEEISLSLAKKRKISNTNSTSNKESIDFKDKIKSDGKAELQATAGKHSASDSGISYDTDHDRDAKAVFEQGVDLHKTKVDELNRGENIYHGQAGYTNFVAKKKDDFSNNKFTGTKGPLRASNYVRTTCRFDYQKDLCKDYYETGYCVFGDTCKFLHDRSDSKSGWELDQEWEDAQKKRDEAIKEGRDPDEAENDNPYFLGSDDEDEDFPFACYICRDEFNEPVVTECGHYFCKKCAISHNKNDTRCAVCDKQTFGVFNVAKKLIQHLKRQEEEDNKPDSDDSLSDDNNSDDDSDSDSDKKKKRSKIIDSDSDSDDEPAGGGWVTVGSVPPK